VGRNIEIWRRGYFGWDELGTQAAVRSLLLTV